MIKIISFQIPMGLPVFGQRMVPGYKLANGDVLMESERDENGLYYAGAGMDGMYLRVEGRYELVRDESGAIIGAERVS